VAEEAWVTTTVQAICQLQQRLIEVDYQMSGLLKNPFLSVLYSVK
jgi:hypothetical protein